MNYEEFIKGNMILLPGRVTEMLANADIEKILSKFPDSKEYEAVIQEMVLKCDFYRLPLKCDVVECIRDSCEDYLKTVHDLSIIDRIIANRDLLIEKYKSIYNELELVFTVTDYMNLEMVGKGDSMLAHLYLKRLVEIVVLAIYADYCIAGYGMCECFDTPEEWTRLWG